jgi:hypothetical protein
VSQLPGKQMTMPATRRHLDEKDSSTRARFLRMYDFDLITDHSGFDAILCNSALIPRSSRPCADAGIREFSPIVAAAVRVAAGAGGPSDYAALNGARPGCVVSVRRFTPA